MKYSAIRWPTERLLRLVFRLNRYKNNSLAYKLHSLADYYDTRPRGEWGDFP